MTIKPVTGRAFKPFGRVIKGYYLRSLIEEMEKTECPSDRVVYEPSVRSLETLKINRQFSEEAYGGMPIQIGYCNGHNSKLNALEYHRDSEINVAATDAILMLGLMKDVQPDFTYDTANVKAFLVPAGTAVEVFATTLHYAPCGVDGNGFQVTIVLPKGTNYPLKNARPRAVGTTTDNEDCLITATNKWLIGHAEGGLDEGSFLGLVGKNLDLND